MKVILSISAVILIGACASGPPVPDWKMNAKSSMDRATAAYLTGNDRVEVQEFARARSEMASTGQFALVARAELVRCASRLASVVLDDCTEFEKLRQDAAPSERAYADYLAGRAQAGDVPLLPEQHRQIALATADSAATPLAGITDPFSRLVAAGALFRTGRGSPAVIAVAVDTSSAQGWRRPLVAWLGVQVMMAEEAGDSSAAQQLRRRIALVQENNSIRP